MDVFEFCSEVNRVVEERYGLDDGGELCYNFIESGQIKMEHGVARAADYVAQMIEQA